MDLLLAVATIYAGLYVGQPLYCGGVYDLSEMEPWVAQPVSAYESGEAQCGDLVYLAGVDAAGTPWSLMARARDAGPLDRYCVELPEGCAPIMADIPAHLAPFPGLSARVERMVNVSAMARAYKLNHSDYDPNHNWEPRPH